MEFKDLKIGDEFDWIGGEYPSFFLRCVKIGEKKYRDSNNTNHFVGSIHAKVFHRTLKKEKRNDKSRNKF
jgi:hypothetical protein